MERDRLIDLPYVIGLVLVPLLVVGALFMVKGIQELTRWERVYFQEEYLERYESPGAVALDLESALRTGDTRLMAELRGTGRQPETLEARPRLTFIFLLGIDGDYFHYLYFNTDNYHRLVQHVKPRGERYVTVEEGLYYYMDSGQWVEVAAPLAATWWILTIVFTGGVYVYRLTARSRSRMYG